jgi:hypothetical protein
MAVRTFPAMRSGRRRGHAAPPRSRSAQLIAAAMRAGNNGASGSQAARAQAARGSVNFKNPATGGEGRTMRMQSTSAFGQNRSNVKRKPSARRTSPFKKMMRKQTIGPQVAREMARQPGMGDHRRTEAQRTVRKRAEARVSRKTEMTEFK